MRSQSPRSTIEKKIKNPNNLCIILAKDGAHNTIACFAFFFSAVWNTMQNVFLYDSRSKVLPMVCKNLQNVPQPTATNSPCLLAICWLCSFLPQGLCTCSSHYLHCSTPRIHLDHSFPPSSICSNTTFSIKPFLITLLKTATPCPFRVCLSRVYISLQRLSPLLHCVIYLFILLFTCTYWNAILRRQEFHLLGSLLYHKA